MGGNDPTRYFLKDLKDRFLSLPRKINGDLIFDIYITKKQFIFVYPE